MKKTEHKLNFYRKILIISAFGYLLFSLTYKFTSTFALPMSQAERIFSAGIFIITYLLSYKNKWFKNRIGVITYGLSFLGLLQLFYYTYLYNFNLELALLVVILTAIFNLVFNFNLLKFITNIIMIVIMMFALYFSETPQVEVPLYLASYIMISALSFYVSYNLEQSQRRIEKNLNQLKEQYQFQKTLAEISSELVNLELNNFDQKINYSLKKIGEYFQIDRSYIFEISEDKITASNKYEWTAPEIEAQKDKLQNLKVENYDWWLKELKKKKIIVIEDLEQMGEESAAEKAILIDQDVQSIIALAIFVEEDLYGFFGFDFVNTVVNFNQTQINQIKIFSDVISRAITKHRDNLKIRKLSYYDSLTGLYNRRFFNVELARLDNKRRLPISIIIADLNGLKIINDSYGHKKGDQMLKKAAEILKNSLRKDDILARWGGDEFIILLPETDSKACTNILQRIKEKTGVIDDLGLPLSIALGQATKVNYEENIEDIIKEADDKMYKNKLSESRSSKSNIVQGLINALDAKSNETKEHGRRMIKLALDFGTKLNLSESEKNRLSLLATLHDIGKINISEEILNKEDELTAKEWEIMKKHTEQGYKIASSSEKFAAIAEEIFYHHEKWDGSGYPSNLEGKEIPFLARIISLVDAYDVMTNERPYSKAVSKEEALTEIKRCAGSHFDPKLAVKFIKMLKNI